jgi:hypothetical protein
MANREGWKIVKNYIDSRLRPVQKEINENFSLEKEEYNVLQGRRMELQKVLDFVDRRVEVVKNQSRG